MKQESKFENQNFENEKNWDKEVEEAKKYLREDAWRRTKENIMKSDIPDEYKEAVADAVKDHYSSLAALNIMKSIIEEKEKGLVSIKLHTHNWVFVMSWDILLTNRDGRWVAEDAKVTWGEPYFSDPEEE